MNRKALIEAMARAMAEPLGARVPYDALPIDASQPKLADGSGLSQELLLDGATAALSAIEASGAVVVMAGQCNHSGECKAAQDPPP